MEYKKVVLSELLDEFESGSRPKGGAIAKGIPSLGAEHLTNDGKFKFNKIKFIPKEYYESLKKGKLLKKDILIVKDGATTGKVSYVEELKFDHSAINEHLFRIKIKNEACAKYIFYYLFSERGQQDILKDFRGATVGGISRKFVEKVQVPLPPKPIQIKIVNSLDKAQELINSRKIQIDKYDELLQSVFFNMFGDVVTNNKKWNIYEFNELCETRLGKMLDKGKDKNENIKSYLGNSNVKWGYFELNEVKKMSFEKNEEEKFLLKYGDILITEGGEVGRTAIWKDEITECYFQKALHRVRINEDIVSREYILYLMKFFAGNNGFKNYVTSATIPHLTGVKLKKMLIPVPPLKLQNKFAEIMEKVEMEKKKMEDSLAELENNFNSIMQRAFKGELF